MAEAFWGVFFKPATNNSESSVAKRLFPKLFTTNLNCGNAIFWSKVRQTEIGRKVFPPYS